jgi:hypothetical protein
LNDIVYRPVDSDDPDVRHLANLIAEQGLLEPIVVTKDNVILSGHRRRVACTMAMLTCVPVRRLPIESTDPEFTKLLVSFNAQRVKGIDVQLREAVVLRDPVKAREKLIEESQTFAEKVAGRIDEAELCKLDPKRARRRAEISPAKQPMLEAAKQVLNKYKEFWPFTIRQLHYRLLNNPPLRHAGKPDSTYRNDPQSYKDLCDLVARARLNSDIPFWAIHDPTRPAESWQNWRHTGAFIREGVEDFLKGYRRDLLQSQSAYFEIVGEKLTLDTIIEKATARYGMRYCIGRGYSSIDLRKKLAGRFRKSGKDRFVLLVLSDFDPEGENIAETLAASLRDEFRVRQITAVKVALTANQVRDLDLTPGMTAKATSSRAAGFVAEHGQHVYELEAVEPDVLEGIIRDSIEAVIDVPLFNKEIEKEGEDAASLEAIREKVYETIAPIVRTSPGDDEQTGPEE